MLHGSLTLAVLPVEKYGAPEAERVSAALHSQYIDMVVVCTSDHSVQIQPNVVLHHRNSGSSMAEVLADLLENEETDIMIDPTMPLTIVYLTELVDVNEAAEAYERSERTCLQSVRSVADGDYLLSADDQIRSAFPRLVSNDPIRFVAPVPAVSIFEYEKFKEYGEVPLLESVGFLIE